MSIYTKKGDDGRTHLVTGERVAKYHARVELYGTVDELNSVIGLAIAHLEGSARDALATELERQQNLLFELGSELAGFTAQPGESVLRETDVEHLEQQMDAMLRELEPMRAFILPGGTPASAALQVGRTVCRRLERQMSRERIDGPNQDEQGREIVMERPLVYVNRLSDYLFVCARYANHRAGVSDTKWSSRAKADLKKSD